MQQDHDGEIFHFPTSKQAPGPKQTSGKWVQRPFQRVEWPEREANHSHPPSVKVTNEGNYTSNHPGVHMETFTFIYPKIVIN
jgi:hypothetical protein